MDNLSQLAEMQDSYFRQRFPHKRFEYVNVTFTAADTDVTIPYTKLRPSDPDAISFTDVTPGAVYSGGIDLFPKIYKSARPDRKVWARPYLVLRSTVAAYTTRLLLFTDQDS